MPHFKPSFARILTLSGLARFAANAAWRQMPVKNLAQIYRQYCKHLEMKLF
jgi:hypothetical protein